MPSDPSGFVPGWYIIDPATQTFQWFATPTLATSQGYYEGQNQILQWGPEQMPNGVASTWSPSYERRDLAKPGDHWDRAKTHNAEAKPGSRSAPDEPAKTEAKEAPAPAAAPAPASAPAPAPFNGNKTYGQLYTRPMSPAKPPAESVAPAESDAPAATSAPGEADTPAVEEPNEALKALLEQQKTPWYERAWNATKSAYGNAVDNVSAVFDEPLEGLKGFGKGMVNMFTSDLWNLGVTVSQTMNGVPIGTAVLDAEAVRFARLGNVAEANRLAATAAAIREQGHVGPLLELSNAAQKGGNVFTIAAPVGFMAKGLTKLASLGKGLGRTGNLSKAAAETAQAERAAQVSKAEEAKQAQKAAGEADGGASVSITKGEFGENTVNALLKERGYNRIDKAGPYKEGSQGIDSIWQDPKTGRYVVVDAKYNVTPLKNTVEAYEGVSVRQLSDPWTESRLLEAFGGDKFKAMVFNTEMVAGNVDRVVGFVSPEGNVVFRLVNAAGRLVRGRTWP
ncbi:Hypothetical protein A7982_05445 [Minicystis rosea]|nr:Hypothetical protein A7982_05445 [Minicystis rosea]